MTDLLTWTFLLQPQSVGYKGSAEPQPQIHYDKVSQGMKFRAPPERNVQRMSYSRKTVPGNFLWS